jgi:hypothetical protein
MRDELKWIKGAISNRAMIADRTFYKLTESEIRATNGELTAGCPCETGMDFLVPGEEFEKVLERLDPETITLKALDNAVRLRSGRFSGTINTLPLDRWSYPGVDGADWKPIPPQLLHVLAELRPFISDNNAHLWATCVALEKGWAYATNNIAVAGAPCDGLDLMALLPVWAVDFVLARKQGLKNWAWTENYVAFQWDNGAWMRSVLVIGQFPERAAEMIREVREGKTSTAITEDFKSALNEVAQMAEDTVLLYADRMVARFKQAEITVAGIPCTIPPNAERSIWAASFLLPAIKAADSWSPDLWPKPAPFKGKTLVGLVRGRQA